MSIDKIQKAKGQLLRASQVASVLGLSVPSVWRIAKDNANFPKPFKLSARVTVWCEKEILDYIRDKKEETKPISSAINKTQLPKFGTWVNIKDRFPEIGADVLVAIHLGDDVSDSRTYDVAHAKYTGAHEWEQIYHHFIDYDYIASFIAKNITHWMPLPPPPQDNLLAQTEGALR